MGTWQETLTQVHGGLDNVGSRCREIFGIEPGKYLGTAGHPLARPQGFYLPPLHLHPWEQGRKIYLERYQSQFGHQ